MVVFVCLFQSYYSINFPKFNSHSRRLQTTKKKNNCQNFLAQKNPEIVNFKPKKSFGPPFHLKCGVPPLPLGFNHFPAYLGEAAS